MIDSDFRAATATEARDAYRAMLASDYYSGSVVAEFHRHHPEVAVAQAEFDAHLVRDVAEHTARQPTFDAMDEATWPATFGPDDWSEWTRNARRTLDALTEIALGQL